MFALCTSFVTPALNSAVIAVLVVPTKFRPQKVCGLMVSTPAPAATVCATAKAQIIVPAPLAPSRTTKVPAAAVTAPPEESAENEMQSATWRTADSAAIDAVRHV